MRSYKLFVAEQRNFLNIIIIIYINFSVNKGKVRNNLYDLISHYFVLFIIKPVYPLITRIGCKILYINWRFIKVKISLVIYNIDIYIWGIPCQIDLGLTLDFLDLVDDFLCYYSNSNMHSDFFL